MLLLPTVLPPRTPCLGTIGLHDLCVNDQYFHPHIIESDLPPVREWMGSWLCLCNTCHLVHINEWHLSVRLFSTSSEICHALQLALVCHLLICRSINRLMLLSLFQIIVRLTYLIPSFTAKFKNLCKISFLLLWLALSTQGLQKWLKIWQYLHIFIKNELLNLKLKKVKRSTI